MAYGKLLLVVDLAKRASEFRVVEQRVVTEARPTPRCMQDLSLHCARKYILCLAPFSQCDHTDKSRCPPLHTRQIRQQQAVVVGIGGVLPCITR